MQAHNPYTLPTLDPKIIEALESIADAIADAIYQTAGSLHYAMILPLDTDQLTDALSEAIDALKTAYTLAEALQNQPHEFQR